MTGRWSLEDLGPRQDGSVQAQGPQEDDQGHLLNPPHQVVGLLPHGDLRLPPHAHHLLPVHPT